MTTWDVELAKHFKDRDNIDVDEPLICEVISLDPISVSLLNDNAIFTQGINLYVCESLKSITGSITLNTVAEHGAITTNFTIQKTLSINDRVLCIPMANGQKYALIDKIL